MYGEPAAGSAHGSGSGASLKMNLCELIEGIDVMRVTGPTDPGIVSLAYDSRKAAMGALFFALPGEKADGAEFANDAISRGAIAVASSRPRPAEISQKTSWIELRVGNERRALGRAAANFYRNPAKALRLVGITGTNGKTTTAYLVDSILLAAGYTAALLGTTGYRTPKGNRAGANTTPESLDLQQLFAEVRDAGGTHAVLETSSHALALDRLWGCHFVVAIFTNLTRDHLDYHKTFEGYFAAKRLLFEGTGAGTPDVAVINADDPYSTRLEGRA
jgi:UDP-N-acetylmuramoyl-L-alanyl-D-glutamate--2,6-diaminopimelate ligase